MCLLCRSRWCHECSIKPSHIPDWLQHMFGHKFFNQDMVLLHSQVSKRGGAGDIVGPTRYCAKNVRLRLSSLHIVVGMELISFLKNFCFGMTKATVGVCVMIYADYDRGAPRSFLSVSRIGSLRPPHQKLKLGQKIKLLYTGQNVPWPRYTCKQNG